MFKKKENVQNEKAFVVDDPPKDTAIGKVLIVEDTPIAAKIAEMVLAEMGCAATWVASGEEALLKLSSDFHFILMDCKNISINFFKNEMSFLLYINDFLF